MPKSVLIRHWKEISRRLPCVVRRTDARCGFISKDPRLPASSVPLMPWPEPSLRVGFREAWLGGSVLFFDGVDAVRRDERSASWQTLLELLAVHPGVVILSGIPPWLPCDRVVGMLAIRFRVLDRPAAARVWS